MSDPTLFDTRPSPGSDVMVGNRAGRQIETVELAYARTSDPVTSHEAAATLTPEKLRMSQAAVLRLFNVGPMHDVALVDKYAIARVRYPEWYPQQSESGLRTRRKELVRKGLLVDSGERARLVSGRNAIIWRLA